MQTGALSLCLPPKWPSIRRVQARLQAAQLGHSEGRLPTTLASELAWYHSCMAGTPFRVRFSWSSGPRHGGG